MPRAKTPQARQFRKPMEMLAVPVHRDRPRWWPVFLEAGIRPELPGDSPTVRIARRSDGARRSVRATPHRTKATDPSHIAPSAIPRRGR